ncbi:hypothetical protein ACHAW6_003633 [Cyclotella cf. meneghiniana]
MSLNEVLCLVHLAGTEAIIFQIVTFLYPRDLLRLALASKAFGFSDQATSKIRGKDEHRENARKRKGKGNRNVNKRAVDDDQMNGDEQDEEKVPWSVIEEAARQSVLTALAEHEEDKLLREYLRRKHHESWIAVYQRWHLKNTSLVFYRFIGKGIQHVNSDPTRVHATYSDPLAGCNSVHDDRRRTYRYDNAINFFGVQHLTLNECREFISGVAICQEIMESGKHFARFYADQHDYARVGLIRPIQGYPNNRIEIDDYINFCKDQQSPGYEGDVQIVAFELDYFFHSMGFLLDLTQGIVSCHWNDKWSEPLEIFLSGHYCWCVFYPARSKTPVHIERAPIPDGYLYYTSEDESESRSLPQR